MDNVQQIIRDYLLNEMLYAAPDTFDDNTPLVSSRLLDSMGLLKIIVFLEKSFALRVEPNELVPQNFETVNAIADFVRHKTSTT
jgi:acyl carrier protein